MIHALLLVIAKFFVDVDNAEGSQAIVPMVLLDEMGAGEVANYFPA